MPLYDIECPKCGVGCEDYLAKRPEDPMPLCPTCGVPFTKLLSAPDFTFGMPTNPASKVEWAKNRSKQMAQRAADHDNSPRGRAERQDAIARAYGIKKV